MPRTLPSRSALPLFLLLLPVALACGAPETRQPEAATIAAPRALGTLTVEKGDPCGDGDRCIRFVVTCPEVAQPVHGYFVIDDPKGPARGTIVSYSGGDGSRYAQRGNRMSGRYRATTDSLRAEGFRIVQVVWEGGWTNGAPESNEGLGKLACRPATATAWIGDNLVDDGTPLCPMGGSGGAAQVSYLLTHYGLEDRIALAVPFTGYWMGRIDIGCLDTDTLNATLHYNAGARGFIDRTMGYPAGQGPCTKRDRSARAVFEEASISLGGNDYVYPHTLVYIILAGGDQVGALDQGHTYYERLIREGSPQVRFDILPGAPHGLGPAGPPLLREILSRECRFHNS